MQYGPLPQIHRREHALTNQEILMLLTVCMHILMFGPREVIPSGFIRQE